jgi:subtilase family serine protease
VGGHPRLRRATLATMLVIGVLSVASSAVAAPPAFVNLANSYLGPPSATALGPYVSAATGIEVVLQPRDLMALDRQLTALYDPSSPSYHHWLAPGEFVARYEPTASTRASVSDYLRRSGMQVVPSTSPFLVRAVGTSTSVTNAFSTTIENYRAADGQVFFAPAAPVQVPVALSGAVSGVIGLSDTVAEHPLDIRAPPPSVFHYGGGPDGSGLTPSQVDSIYGAGPAQAAGPRGQGRGVTLAVFELSAYTASDIATYARHFFGPSHPVPLTDIAVDGGSLTPQCPPGDTCARKNDYHGDIEVEADIETQMAMAPDAKGLLVYDAPNDKSGQTGVDEYLRMAADDVADSISTSWGLCEPDLGAAVAAAENVAFTQMAMQGQSITAAAGDDGAYDCIGDGTSNKDLVAVDDPASQPLVTAVGGTSLETFDPGRKRHPGYPTGIESVWNDDNACNGTPAGLQACAVTGAGGGGVSVFWPRPTFQKGPGVAALHNREVPDVSADADEATPYAEYCAGRPDTNSACARTGGGWFGIGGTSLSSPLWAAVIGDAIGFNGARMGTATTTLYPLFQSHYAAYFHDITGVGQSVNQNGHYPVTPNYDLATGIGTPVIGAIVTETGSAPSGSA